METKGAYVIGMDELKLTLLDWLTNGPQTMEVLCARLPERDQFEILDAIMELQRCGADIRLDFERGYVLHLREK